RALLPISRLGAGLAVALLLGACGERSAAAGTAAASPADAPAPAAATATIDPANWPQPAWPFADDPALEQKVDALLASMTVEEKVGQIIQGDIDSITPDDVRKYRLGSILAGGGSDPGREYNAEPAAWLALADAFW